MYADRHTRRRIDPASLGVAVAVNAAVVAVLLLSNPSIVTVLKHHDLTTFTVPPEPVPEPLPPPPQQAKPLPRQHIETTPPIVQPIDTSFTLPQTPLPPLPPIAQEGTGSTPVTVIATPTATPTPAPVLVAPSVDPRYAADLQPTYPPEETRAGHNGRVVVRVLIGIDGRVKQVQPISATSDAFLRVTRERALSRWRFKPATRDGIPVEGWRQMAISFVLQDD